MQTTTQTEGNFVIATVIARDSAELIKLVTLPVYCDRLMGHSLWLVLFTWAFYLNTGFATLDNCCKKLFFLESESQDRSDQTLQIGQSHMAALLPPQLFKITT